MVFYNVFSKLIIVLFQEIPDKNFHHVKLKNTAYFCHQWWQKYCVACTFSFC